MIQMILDTGGVSIALKESQDGGYYAHEEPHVKDVTMVSGRIVREYKNKSWVASHQYGYLNDSERKDFLSACEKGTRTSILCSILNPNTDELTAPAPFIVEEYREPKFMWSREGKPMWADFYVRIREVNPHA